MKNIRAYVAELLGTFLLALLVHLSLGANFGVPTPVVAGLTLGLIVYMLGGVSGAHVNPAVTLGLWSVKKFPTKDLAGYLVAQFAGAALAMVVGDAMTGGAVMPMIDDTVLVGVAEALGAAILVLGVSSVVHGKAPGDAAGITIGSALVLGASAASVLSNGVVNPAVALGIHSFSIVYLICPIVGGVLAAWGYRWMVKK